MDFLELGKLLLIIDDQVESCEKDLLLMKDTENREKLNLLLQQMETCKNTTSVYSKLVKNNFERIFAKINTVEKALKARLEQEAPKEIPMDDNILIDVSDSGDMILNPFILELVDDPRLEKPSEPSLFNVTLKIIPWYGHTNEIQSPSPCNSLQEVSEMTPEKTISSTPNQVLKDPRLNPSIKSYIYVSPIPKNDQNCTEHENLEGSSLIFAKKKEKSRVETLKSNGNETKTDEIMEKFAPNFKNGDKNDRTKVKNENLEAMEDFPPKKNEKTSLQDSKSKKNRTDNGNSDQIELLEEIESPKNENFDEKEDLEENIPLFYFRKVSNRELNSLKFDETSLFFKSKRAKRVTQKPKNLEIESHAIQKMKKCSVILTRCDNFIRKSL